MVDSCEWLTRANGAPDGSKRLKQIYGNGNSNINSKLRGEVGQTTPLSFLKSSGGRVGQTTP